MAEDCERMVELNAQERFAVGLAAAVVILSLISGFLFIYYRGSNLFYVTAVLAVIAGFYMAYHLSKQGTGAVKKGG